jgi:hypothetical protein
LLLKWQAGMDTLLQFGHKFSSLNQISMVVCRCRWPRI